MARFLPALLDVGLAAMPPSFPNPVLLDVVGVDVDLRAMRPNAGRSPPRQGLERVMGAANMAKF